MVTQKTNLVKKLTQALRPLHLDNIIVDYNDHTLQELNSGNYMRLYCCIIQLLGNPNNRIGCINEDQDCKEITNLLFDCYLKLFWKKTKNQRLKNEKELTYRLTETLTEWLSPHEQIQLIQKVSGNK